MENVRKEIEFKLENGQGYITSREVATMFGKKHKNVLRSIKAEIERYKGARLKNELTRMFVLNEYIDEQNKIMKEYKLNKNGFNQIAFGFNGDKASCLRLEFILAFDKLEQDYHKLVEYALEKDSMIMKQKDKIEFTVNELYPILRKHGVYENRIYKVHESIKKKLLGKYENITKADNFNSEKFKLDYELTIIKIKESNSKYFSNSNSDQLSFDLGQAI